MGFVLVHTGLLVGEFFSFRWAELYSEISLFLEVIRSPPSPADGGGLSAGPARHPVADRRQDLRQLAYENTAIPVTAGWILYLILPGAGHDGPVVFARASRADAVAGSAVFLRRSCCWRRGSTSVSTAFFRFPWRLHWTTRTPNAIVFTICAALLTSPPCTHRGSDRGFQNRSRARDSAG
jgi:hypothetical protein